VYVLKDVPPRVHHSPEQVAVGAARASQHVAHQLNDLQAQRLRARTHARTDARVRNILPPTATQHSECSPPQQIAVGGVTASYVPPGPQLPPQPLRELLPVSPLGEQRHDGCEQFA